MFVLETGQKDIIMASDDDNNMNVDPPLFSALLSNEDSMHTIVMVNVEHETDDMGVEVRLECPFQRCRRLASFWQ